MSEYHDDDDHYDDIPVTEWLITSLAVEDAYVNGMVVD